MSAPLTGWLRAHGSIRLPLLELRNRNAGAAPGPDAVRDLSAALPMPEAALRGALSYYGDFRAAAGEVRVCRGTSCLLAGGGPLHEEAARGAPCRAVYCLGYCDRSPAALRADGAAVVHCRDVQRLLRSEAPPAPPAPSLRCTAPKPIVTRRIGAGGGADLAAARADGVYEALRQVLAGSPEAVIQAMEASGERGRGGAGFPAGRKWRSCAEAPGAERYAVANGDEGDPGSFIDRVLMEGDPHTVLEGLAICAFAVRAQQGIVFIRSEYPAAIARMERAVAEARDAGVLGRSVLGSDFSFDVTVFPGLGSYVCGEETALLNAIEGHRGEVRLRPPYPVQQGLWGCPTVVNNVETLVNVPWIMRHGAAAYRALGTAESSGTKAICLNHGFARPGIVEIEMGMTLRDLIEREAGGPREGETLEAVVLGGPMGSLLAPEEWDVPVCYAALSRRGIQLGHGGLVAVPRGADFRALLEHWLEFMQDESCGKCVPCRVGSRRALECARGDRGGDRRPEIERLLEVMADASLCAFGQQMPRPMRRMIERFGDRIFDRPRPGRST